MVLFTAISVATQLFAGTPPQCQIVYDGSVMVQTHCNFGGKHNVEMNQDYVIVDDCKIRFAKTDVLVSSPCSVNYDAKLVDDSVVLTLPDFAPK